MRQPVASCALCPRPDDVASGRTTANAEMEFPATMAMVFVEATTMVSCFVIVVVVTDCEGGSGSNDDGVRRTLRSHRRLAC